MIIILFAVEKMNVNKEKGGRDVKNIS